MLTRNCLLFDQLAANCCNCISIILYRVCSHLVSSPVMLPAASNVGVVAPPTDVTSFWALAVRACVTPSVATPSKFPAAS